MKNIPLLRKVFEHISDHPEDWRQAYWGSLTDASLVAGQDPQEFSSEDFWGHPMTFQAIPVAPTCGTAMCFAGWAVCMDDPKARLLILRGSYEADEVLLGDGQVMDISKRAQEVLGLHREEADRLFSGGNTLDEIERTLREWEVIE